MKPANSNRSTGGTASVFVSLLLAGVFLILPAMAVHRLHVDWRWASAYAVMMSALSYWAYARDKRSAQAGEWRVSEAQLHLWELLGGWPGALVAQRRLRHKYSKASYQLVFWLIVLGYQFAAVDSFQDWKLSRAGLKWLEQTSRRSR